MKLGDLDLCTVSDGTFRLDGGSMFGIVPKVLWEKRIAADEKNRITLGMHCLLIRDGKRNLLIETGTGSKLGAKENDIYALDRKLDLERSLSAAGLTPQDITDVFITHLHFDHAGGATKRTEDRKIIPTFSNARYHLNRGAWDEAENTPDYNRRSYMPENYHALREHDRIAWLNGSQDIYPGVRVEVSGGHTDFHSCVLLQSKGQKAIFWGDLVPTIHHLRGPYITAFDLQPLVTLKRKTHWINQAIKEHWLSIFYHDHKVNMAYLDRKKDGQIVVLPVEKG